MHAWQVVSPTRRFVNVPFANVWSHFANEIKEALIYFKPIWRGGGLKETGRLFNLETRMVSVLHKELEYKVEKL